LAVRSLYACEGADIAIAYLGEYQDTEDAQKIVEKEGCRCIVISGDVAGVNCNREFTHGFIPG
jgi:hypothetical protein